MNYKQRMAILNAYKKDIKHVCPSVSEQSGIYVFTRIEDGVKFAYVGQAKHLLTRLAQHLMGYKQHIDLSLRKRKLYSEDNPNGYKIDIFFCNETELDDKEREYILTYANNGWQLYNKTFGGQNEGKAGLKETQRKGYQEGLHNGYEKARKDVAHWFDLHLKYGIKSDKPNKIQEKAMKKFEDFIAVDKND